MVYNEDIQENRQIMAEPSLAQDRPTLPHNDTLDAPALVGSISGDGIASLKPRRSSSSASTRPRIQDHDQREKASSSPGTSSSLETSEEEEIEDYDSLELDPGTIIEGSTGGELGRSLSMSRSEANIPRAHTPAGTGHIRIKSDTHIRQTSPSTHRKSIQIRLEKTNKKGRYVLTADDPEMREILRKGLEREEASQDPSKRARTIRDYVFTRQFTTFDRQNPLSSESPFHGFFTLFWLAMVLLFVRISAYNWKQYGNPLGNQAIMKMMFGRDVFVLGITDAVMCLSTGFGFFLQKAIAKGYLSWSRSGWIIQNLWQTFFLFAVVSWTLYREWPWTHTVFIVIHCLVFVMKQHSYAFYNGYLSSILRRRKLVLQKLQRLREIKATDLGPDSPGLPSPMESMSTAIESPAGFGQDKDHHRRRSMPPRTSTNLGTESSDVASVSASLEAGMPLDHNQMQTFERIIQEELDGLDKALQGKAGSAKNAYPHNLTARNLIDWTFLPTLVYELEYPRQDKINWHYVGEKTAATFGVLAVMQIISQAYIYPVVAETVRMREVGVSMIQRWEQMPWTISDLTFPLLLEQLLTWYLIWVCVVVGFFALGLSCTDVRNRNACSMFWPSSPALRTGASTATGGTARAGTNTRETGIDLYTTFFYATCTTRPFPHFRFQSHRRLL